MSPPPRRCRWAQGDSAAGALRCGDPPCAAPAPHSRLRAWASNWERFCRVASLTSTLSPLSILPGRSSRSLCTEFSEATTTSAYLWGSPGVGLSAPWWPASPPLYPVLFGSPCFTIPRQEKHRLPLQHNGCWGRGEDLDHPPSFCPSSHPLDWPLARFSANFSSTTS